MLGLLANIVTVVLQTERMEDLLRKINFRYNSNKPEFKKKFECQIFIENSNPKNLREILVLGLKKLINSQAIKNGCQ